LANGEIENRNSIFRRLSHKRGLWITLYAIYIIFILLSATAFYAEQTIETRASGTYSYSLTFEKDGVQKEHYIVTRTLGSQPGRIYVTFNADLHTLDVETINIRQITVDCRSIAKDKSREILGKEYEDNENYYKTYFLDKGKEFTINVNADHDIALTLRDVPYPSKVTVDGQVLEEGANKDYTYDKGTVVTNVGEGQSQVMVYFEDNAPNLAPNFKTNSKYFYHITNDNIEFDATASTGNIIDYIWDFGDGIFGTGDTTTHSYNEEGNYNVILVVRDGNGLIKSISHTLYVHDQDADGLPDDWEVDFFGGITQQQGNQDYDGDGLTNQEEYEYNTNPKRGDTDNDGFSDKEEVDKNTDPTSSISKPAAADEDEDNGIFGMGPTMDYYIILILIVVIVVILIGLTRGKGEEEEEEEEEEYLEAAEVEEEEEEEEEEGYECPECGSPIREDQPECDECGAILEWDEEDEEEVEDEFEDELEDEEYEDEDEGEEEEEEEEFECPTCGASVQEEDTVCPTCGEEFE
jgi:hypothetical protein